MMQERFAMRGTIEISGEKFVVDPVKLHDLAVAFRDVGCRPLAYVFDFFYGFTSRKPQDRGR